MLPFRKPFQEMRDKRWDVVGVDNNLRAWFFGAGSTTRPMVQTLARELRAESGLGIIIVTGLVSGKNDSSRETMPLGAAEIAARTSLRGSISALA